MRGSVLEARRRGIEDNHLIILLNYALHLLFELLLILEHHLALHNVKLSI